jgi:hypothetical protein
VKVAAATTVLALAVAVAGVVDHRHKNVVIHRSQIYRWYCNHGYAAWCSRFDEEGVERRWNERERGYVAVLATLAVAAAALVAVRIAKGPGGFEPPTYGL